MTDRTNYLGASDVGVLFGKSPFKSYYTLWMEKSGRLPPEPDTPAAERGRFLEPAVANWLHYRTGWELEHWPQDTRKTHSRIKRFGCTPDYIRTANTTHMPHGPAVLPPGPVDIKVPISFSARKWIDDEPPLYWQLQLQAQIGLLGHQWGALAVLIGDQPPLVFEYDFRPGTYALIERAVEGFWMTIDKGIEPEKDFADDYETIKRVYREAVPGKKLDLSTNNRLPNVIAEYQQASADAKEAKSRHDAAAAEIMEIMGDASECLSAAHRITANVVEATTYTATRGAYRNLRISQRKA